MSSAPVPRNASSELGAPLLMRTPQRSSKEIKSWQDREWPVGDAQKALFDARVPDLLLGLHPSCLPLQSVKDLQASKVKSTALSTLPGHQRSQEPLGPMSLPQVASKLCPRRTRLSRNDVTANPPASLTADRFLACKFIS